MAWSTSLSDLRNLLGDSAQGRSVYRKKLLGQIDGVNVVFKTFEPRRITNFTDVGAVPPIGIYVNGAVLAPSAILSDDTLSGEVVLKTAPLATSGGKPSVVQATYFYQWFLDAELNGFLGNALNWAQLGADITLTPDGLRPAVLHYGASDALRFLAMRQAERVSSMYLLEDAPKKEALGVADTFIKLADSYAKRADQLRSGYYKRSDQAEAPLFSNNFGSVSPITPRR